jgi:glyoxylase-like metal-dependent hydrolase (beta-lactamase superfamily II)
LRPHAIDRPCRGLCLGLLVASLGGGCASSEQFTRVGDVQVRTFRRAFANVHVVERAGVRILVDSGYREEAAGLDAELRRAGIDPARLAAVVVTHAHADHAGGARWLKDHYGTRIIAGSADRAAFAGGRNEKLCPVGALGRSRYAKDQAGTFDPVDADVWIDGPTSLAPLIGLDATVLPMPSHTPGSIAVLVGKAALVGDLVRGAVIGSAAEVHFFMCDLAANRADVQRLLGLKPELERFFPGHFGPLHRAAVRARFGR